MQQQAMMSPNTSARSSNANDNNVILARYFVFAIGVITLPFLLKYDLIHNESKHVDQSFFRPIDNGLNNRSHSTSSSKIHRELRQHHFCRHIFGTPDQKYQTVTVSRTFRFSYALLHPNAVYGTCGDVCPEICDHKPCFADFESADDSICECFLDGDSQCMANSFCTEETDTCTCNVGYEGDSLTGCIDINECLNVDCGPNGKCVNTPGSYKCECNKGYQDTSPSGGCIDINECLTGAPCGPNSICTNNVGSFSCACASGYTGTPPSIFCTDINECTTRAPCGPNSICNNIAGSFSCICNQGYNNSSPTGTCFNINECIEGGNNCNVISEDCTDTLGSFTCSCKTGYQGQPGACVDVDECATENICGSNATCTNSIGSYNCKCNDGFVGGSPPQCRKLFAYEKCPGSNSDCESGLECSITSRTDSSTSCCPSSTAYACQVNKRCCSGAYTEGQGCPSQSDIDCRDGLTCARRSALNATYICCDNTLPFGTTRVCII